MDIRHTRPTGGSRKFTITSTYDEIVDAIGKPDDVSDVTDKIDVEWNIKDADTGRRLNIWNYKNGPNYQGEKGTPPEEIESWSADGDESLMKDLGLDFESYG